MKLKIVKITFLVVCIAAFIFLLLPFLETTPPPTPAQLKAQPQVAAENPLTAIAKRLALLFRPHGERQAHLSSGYATPQTGPSAPHANATLLAQNSGGFAQAASSLPPTSTHTDLIPLPAP